MAIGTQRQLERIVVDICGGGREMDIVDELLWVDGIVNGDKNAQISFEIAHMNRETALDLCSEECRTVWEWLHSATQGLEGRS